MPNSNELDDQEGKNERSRGQYFYQEKDIRNPRACQALGREAPGLPGPSGHEGTGLRHIFFYKDSLCVRHVPRREGVRCEC